MTDPTLHVVRVRYIRRLFRRPLLEISCSCDLGLGYKIDALKGAYGFTTNSPMCPLAASRLLHVDISPRAPHSLEDTAKAIEKTPR